MRPKLTPILVIPALLLTSCTSVSAPNRVYRMGELATVGPVIYNVLETEWKTEIGESLQQKIPTHKFLLIRMTITNSGNRDVAVPLLTLEDPDGQEYLEYSEVEYLPNWLGLLRIVQPAATIQGLVVFDAPVSDYKLRVTDGGDLESEKIALVDIPLTFGAPDPIQMPGEPTMD